MKRFKQSRSRFQWLLSCVLMLAVLAGCLAVLPATVSAADPGATMSNAIDINFGSVYSKTWTKDTDHLNHYNKITVNDQGIICIEASKPFDDEGEYGGLKFTLYNEDGEALWANNSYQAVENARDYYRVYVGVKPGVYYLTLQPGFTVQSGLIETDYVISFEQNDYCEAEPNGDGQTATFMEFDQVYTGYFGSDGLNCEENDYFKFPVAAGGEYRIYAYEVGKLTQTSTIAYFIAPEEKEVYLKSHWEKYMDNDGAAYADMKVANSGTAYIYLSNFIGAQFKYAFRVVPLSCIKNGHSCDSWIVEKAPTCTEAGLESGYCNVCMKDQTREIPALGHDIIVEKGKAATCTEDGLTEGRHCDRCGEVLAKQEVIPATGHHFEDGSCDRCGAVAVSIKTQPKNGYAKMGETVKVSVKAKGDDLKYQWYIKNDGSSKYSKSSVKGATYSVTMSDKVKGRRVYCVITDAYGNSVKTKTVLLRESLSIITQPKNTYAQLGKTAKVKIEASGDDLTYEWYIKNAGAKKYSKSSVTKATYSCKMNEKSKDRYVYCVVTDKYGNTEKSKTIVLREAVSIVTQPKTGYAASGKTVKVSVKASGDGLTYRWFFKNEGSSKYTESSVTSATYSTKMTSKVNGRRVYCIVTDQYGKTVKSDVVKLKMK